MLKTTNKTKIVTLTKRELLECLRNMSRMEIDQLLVFAGIYRVPQINIENLTAKKFDENLNLGAQQLISNPEAWLTKVLQAYAWRVRIVKKAEVSNEQSKA